MFISLNQSRRKIWLLVSRGCSQFENLRLTRKSKTKLRRGDQYAGEHLALPSPHLFSRPVLCRGRVAPNQILKRSECLLLSDGYRLVRQPARVRVDACLQSRVAGDRLEESVIRKLER